MVNEIDNYMTISEAAHRWGKNVETVKSRLKPSLHAEQIEKMKRKGLIKSFQKPDGQRKEWIITNEAMEMWFGEKIDIESGKAHEV